MEQKSNTAFEPQNTFVAEKLNEVADLLEQQHASMFRVKAYREAAEYLASLPRPVADTLELGGVKALVALPNVGSSIASAVQELCETGTLSLVERLRGSFDPEALFQTVPMIGPKLAETIHDELQIETLEALEAAAYDGRLAKVPGVGSRRLSAIRHSLSQMLSRRRPKTSSPIPSVATLLDVDREYRERAIIGDLPLITPRRFNPTGTARIPILHTDREDWHFTVLFSNTPLAHKLKRTKDWVVMFFQKTNVPEQQCTVVTERHGPLSGIRVVRGQEKECAELYKV